MKLLFTVFCTLYVCSTFSQKNNSSFLVTRNADTLYGIIDRIKDSVTITTIERRRAFLVSDLRCFKNGKKLHAIYSGTLYPFNDNIDRDKQMNISSYDTTLVLTSVYSSPKMDLMEGHDRFRRTYFFVQRPVDTMPIQMMVSYHYQAQHNSSVAINLAKVMQVQVKPYIQQLKNLMPGCNISNKEWEFMDYRSYSFKRIIQLYNKCN